MRCGSRFHMTIITIASVGYTEVHELGDTGKVFTIVIQPEDTVIAVGKEDNLDQLEKALSPLNGGCKNLRGQGFEDLKISLRP